MRTHALVLCLSFAGCADSPAVQVDEEPVSAAKADSVDYDNWTYIELAANDTRRCASPMCGGMFVKRANQPTIKCIDGLWAKQCYVAEYDFSAIASGDDEQTLVDEARAGRLLVRGQIVKAQLGGVDTSVLAVTEAWSAVSDAPAKGTFYRAHDLGIMCFAAPCLSTELVRLNRNASPLSRVAGVDLSKLGLDEDEAAMIWQELRDGHVIVSGKLKTVSGPAGKADSLIAAQLYTRFVSADIAGEPCGGRLGACPDGYFCQFPSALCGMADGTGTCEATPAACTDEYAPVCGCDGVTYSNDCARKSAGAGFGTDGECKVAASCELGGCRGEMCRDAGAEGRVSICLVAATDHCFHDFGVCEPQADGCGWTMSPELEGCLANP